MLSVKGVGVFCGHTVVAGSFTTGPVWQHLEGAQVVNSKLDVSQSVPWHGSTYSWQYLGFPCFRWGEGVKQVLKVPGCFTFTYTMLSSTLLGRMCQPVVILTKDMLEYCFPRLRLRFYNGN